MLRAQLGQSVVFKTTTKLKQIFINIGGAIAIGALHYVLRIRNASLSHDFETWRKSTLRMRRYLYSILECTTIDFGLY